MKRLGSFECPRCDGPTQLRDTSAYRPVTGMYVDRKHRCKLCRITFVTRQAIFDERLEAAKAEIAGAITPVITSTPELENTFAVLFDPPSDGPPARCDDDPDLPEEDE